MRTELVRYDVNYTDSNRTEGGPRITRHFDTIAEAMKFVDSQNMNDNCHSFEIIKQHSVITRTRIA